MRDELSRRQALWTMLWRTSRWRLAVVAVMAVVQGLAPIGAVLAAGVLIGSLSSRSTGQAALGLGLFGSALLIAAVLNAALDYQVQVLDGRYGRTVHETVAGATLHTAGIAALEDPQVAGELAALEEFERVDGFVGTVNALRQLVSRRMTGVGAFALLFAFAWWAPLVMLVGWRALGYGVGRWLASTTQTGSEVAASHLGRARYIRSLAVQSPAAKEVRIFGLADWIVNGYAEAYRAGLELIWTDRKLGMRSVLAATFAVTVCHAVVLGALARQAFTGQLPTSQLVVYGQAVLASNALGYIFGAEVPLARARQVAMQALRLEHQLAQPTPGHAALTPRPVEPAVQRPRALAVEVTGVCFRYPARDRATLRDLSLVIPAGQSVAIVGENGAGKSTLVKLLCGLYEPGSGRITIDGFPPAQAPGRIGVIFQNFVRYELPLRANVEFGNLRTAGDDILLDRALSGSGARELADGLPHGPGTVLSSGYPGGRDLSGGEWQKIALARALAAVHGGAGVLILDEPTSSLDVTAEVELFDRFLTVTKDVTTILVSHRLASVRRADRIVVIDDGRIAEDGTHEELIFAGGRYAEMFSLQASRFGAAGLTRG